MKTENLTHGSYKAVREVFCNILCFCEEWQGVVQVVFAVLIYNDFLIVLIIP